MASRNLLYLISICGFPAQHKDVLFGSSEEKLRLRSITDIPGRKTDLRREIEAGGWKRFKMVKIRFVLVRTKSPASFANSRKASPTLATSGIFEMSSSSTLIPWDSRDSRSPFLFSSSSSLLSLSQRPENSKFLNFLRSMSRPEINKVLFIAFGGRINSALAKQSNRRPLEILVIKREKSIRKTRAGRKLAGKFENRQFYVL